MFLGIQRAEPGSKYPFDENSKYVSNFPFSDIDSLDNKIPCNFFSDVIVDCDYGFDLILSPVQSSAGIKFSWSLGASSGDFLLTKGSFYHTDTAMVVLSGAVIRVRSQLGDNLWRIVESFDNFEAFGDVGIRFDPNCFRVREKKLMSFEVGNKSVSGDVLLRSGYNAGISIYDQFGSNNSFLIDLSPGAGEGNVPCDDIASGGPLSGLHPDSDGAVRIESDDCYSIIPVSSNVLQISGNCSVCCSCEGDYLPVAIAVTNLINKINTSYLNLKGLIARYNAYIDSAPAGQPVEGALKVSANAKWYDGSVTVSVGIVNMLNSGRTMLTGLLLSFSGFTINFSNGPVSVPGVTESRLIQIGSTSRKQITVPSSGLYLPAGNTMAILSNLTLDDSEPSGAAIGNSFSVNVTATFLVDNQGSEPKTITQSVIVNR